MKYKNITEYTVNQIFKIFSILILEMNSMNEYVVVNTDIFTAIMTAATVTKCMMISSRERNF